MPHATPSAQAIRSVRPEMTAELMARTGLDEARLTELVHRFYGRVRAERIARSLFIASQDAEREAVAAVPTLR